jgi:putative transposase
LHWLYEAKKRYGLIILNYAVTSNHVHLLVFDAEGRDVIPQSIKLIAGRTGQEYNSRKNRKGAFWEDRYHATAVELEQHLLRCLAYIDMNMVRAGVVSHPSEWPYCGYNEIQKPRRKCVLIDYNKLAKLAGFANYDAFRESHFNLVAESVVTDNNRREAWWSESIAVGSDFFVENIKKKLGLRAKGRKVKEIDEGFQLRESIQSYIADSDCKVGHIEPQNTYFVGINDYNTGC